MTRRRHTETYSPEVSDGRLWGAVAMLMQAGVVCARAMAGDIGKPQQHAPEEADSRRDFLRRLRSMKALAVQGALSKTTVVRDRVTIEVRSPFPTHILRLRGVFDAC